MRLWYNIIKEANAEAEVLKKDKILQAKEKFLQLKSEHEKYINEKNQRIQVAGVIGREHVGAGLGHAQRGLDAGCGRGSHPAGHRRRTGLRGIHEQAGAVRLEG